MAIRHTKTNNIPDPTQAELDAEIALGNYPLGTLLADIALPSDWNTDHTNPDIADVTGLQAALDAKGALTTVEKDLGSVPRSSGKFTITGLSGLTISLLSSRRQLALTRAKGRVRMRLKWTG